MKKAKLANAGVLCVAAATLAVVYQLQLETTNAYLGYLPGIFSIPSMLLLIPMVAIVAATIPATVRRPSDLFVLFYTVIVLLSCSLFSQVTGVVDRLSAAILFLILIVPVILVLLTRRIRISANINGLFDRRLSYYALMVLVGMAVVIGTAGNEAAGFGLDSMYERRLAGRESIGSRNLTAYLLSMTMNGVGPFLAFVGANKKQLMLVSASIFLGLFAFWLLGLKAPLALSLFFLGLGYFMRTGRIRAISTFTLVAVLFVGVICLIELAVYDYSLIAEFVVRRAFVVQAALQTYFFDLVASAAQDDASAIMVGIDPGIHGSLTFMVGATYLNKAAANANTNAFLLALANGGLILFTLASVFVAMFFAFLDNYYRATKRVEIFFVAAIYALLLTEQAFTTAMVSSGVAAVFVVTLLIRNYTNRRSQAPAAGPE